MRPAARRVPGVSSIDPKQRLGFIGLGNMGLPMCRRLLEAGYEVMAFDLNADALAGATAAGATPAATVGEVASKVDVLLTSLPQPTHVASVMRGDGALAAMQSGSLWIDLTTNERSLVEALASEAPEGVGVVDSPVTGAVDGARTGRLTLFAGGDVDDLARAVPILAEMGRVIECGLLGTGNVVKLVTNQLWFIHSAAIGEGFALGMANGVELSVLYDAICDSVGDSFVARHDAPSIFAGHYDPTFTLALCLKDLRLLSELQRAVGVELPLTTAARTVFTEASARYGPDVGELHVAKLLEDDAQLSFRLDGDWTPPWEVT